MKLAFINPHKISRQLASASPPLNLGVLASYIRKHEPGVEIKIIDGLIGHDIDAELERFKPDMVAITSTTPTITDAYSLGDALMKKYIVVMGGVHPTCMPEEASRHCHYVVVGEGERAMLELVQGFMNDRIPKDTILERPIITDLDEIPMPAYDLIDMDAYINSIDNSAKTIVYSPQDSKALTIISSRGCPFKCLSGDTLINTDEGKIPIKDLVGKDKIGVYTYDKKTKEVFITDAINIRKTGHKKIVRVLLNNKTFIDCTPDHKFFTIDKRMVQARYLKPNMRILSLNKSQNNLHNQRVVLVKEIGSGETYNLEVPLTHCYFANGVLVKNCSFCHNSWRMTPTRYHSAKRVIEELQYLIKNYGINSFFFADDEFIMNKPRMEEIIRLLKEKKIKVFWACQARADMILKFGLDYLKKIKESGCTLISIGAESGNQRVLTLLKRDGTTVDMNRRAIKLVKEAGIKVSASFMIGVPTETREEMLDTLNFVLSSGLDSGGVGIATPYPKTELWNMAVKSGMLKEPVDYASLLPNNDPERALIVNENMTRSEFIQLYTHVRDQVSQVIYLNKIKSGNLSVYQTIKQGLYYRPKYILTFPFKHPLKTMEMFKAWMETKK